MIGTDNLQESYQQWLHHDEGAMVVYALSFLDVRHMLQSERVNHAWWKLCKKRRSVIIKMVPKLFNLTKN
jgi:signal transduction histidine kinase